MANLYIDLLQVEWVFYRSLVKNENILVSAYFLFLQQDQITITQEGPKGFTWHKH